MTVKDQEIEDFDFSLEDPNSKHTPPPIKLGKNKPTPEPEPEIGQIPELPRVNPKALIWKLLDQMDDPQAQAEMVKQIFPGKDGLLFRALTYSYLYSVYAYDHPEIDPKHFPLNFIGAPGLGKSATIYAWGRKLGIEIVIRTLAGVSDFESLFGIVHIDPDGDTTKFYPPKNLPKAYEHNRPAMIFIDD